MHVCRGGDLEACRTELLNPEFLEGMRGGGVRIDIPELIRERNMATLKKFYVVYIS